MPASICHLHALENRSERSALRPHVAPGTRVTRWGPCTGRIIRGAGDFRRHALPSPESPNQSAARDRAATLSLIGLSIQLDGVEDGDDVVVELDAWFVGNALNAVDDDGLLSDPLIGRR